MDRSRFEPPATGVIGGTGEAGLYGPARGVSQIACRVQRRETDPVSREHAAT
nr:hypothetical protein [uncultured Roseovarius sp.]